MTDVRQDDSIDEKRLRRPALVVGLALALGLAVDWLVLRHPIGLGSGLVGIGIAAGLMVARTFFGVRTTRESFVLAAGLGVWSFFLVLRTAPTLVFLNTVAAVLLLGLTFRLLESGGLSRWTIAEYVRAGFATLGGWLAEPLAFFTVDLADRRPKTEQVGLIGKVLLGIALALPLLGIFMALFSSADPVFESYLNRFLMVDIDFAALAGHLLAVLGVGWLAVGAVRYALVVEARPPTDERRPLLGRVEGTTILVLLNGLFLVFVVVQSAYLFGGAETLSRVGLTYSEYARRGFFELVAVGSLVVGVVLTMDWLIHRWAERSRTIDVLHGGLIGLTAVVLISALQRMLLYTDAFGLTELRLYTTVFMGWVFLMLGWLAFTVLRGQRARFALGAFVSGLAVLAGLTLSNPAAVIVRTNVHHETLVTADIDTGYLVDLGSDAVPALIAALDEVEPCRARTELASALLRSGSEGFRQPGTDWRSLTWSVARADHELDIARPHLEEIAAGGCR